MFACGVYLCFLVLPCLVLTGGGAAVAQFSYTPREMVLSGRTGCYAWEFFGHSIS